MKELKTIHELCVNIVDKEMEKKAMTGEGFTLEEKKAIATSLNLLWTKTKLKFGLKFILRCLDEEWELDAESSYDCGEKCTWEPSKSKYYTVANILLYCNGYKTFKQFERIGWFELFKIVTDELSSSN